MSEMGHLRHIRDVRAMSASLPTSDILLSRSKGRSGPHAPQQIRTNRLHSSANRRAETVEAERLTEASNRG
jgi:hypothetical protein